MSQVTSIRIRVQALVPTQAYGNVTLEAERVYTAPPGHAFDEFDTQLVLTEMTSHLAAYIARMNCDGASAWLRAINLDDKS
jgi:hypothetical protein